MPARRTLIWLLAWPPDAVRAESRDEGAARHPEERGGPRLVACALLERVEDPAPLEVVELAPQITAARGGRHASVACRATGRGRGGRWGLGDRRTDRLRRRTRVEQEVLGQQRASASQHHRSLDRVAQLADVARPAMRRERGDRLGAERGRPPPQRARRARREARIIGSISAGLSRSGGS